MDLRLKRAAVQMRREPAPGKRETSKGVLLEKKICMSTTNYTSTDEHVLRKPKGIPSDQVHHAPTVVAINIRCNKLRKVHTYFL